MLAYMYGLCVSFYQNNIVCMFAGNLMERIYYDILPDCSVSVFVCGDWDVFKSFQNLQLWCESEFLEFDLVDITDTTFQERLLIMDIEL